MWKKEGVRENPGAPVASFSAAGEVAPTSSAPPASPATSVSPVVMVIKCAEK